MRDPGTENLNCGRLFRDGDDDVASLGNAV